MVKRLFCSLLLSFFALKIESANIPVLTSNFEFGTRYELDFDSPEDDDYQTFNSYRFRKGYLQLNEIFSPAVRAKFYFYYNLKNYEFEKVKDNNAYSYSVLFQFGLLPKLDLLSGLKFTRKEFVNAADKDSRGCSPELEVRYSPVKKCHLGAKYNFKSEQYQTGVSDYLSNRGSVWYEQEFARKINLRLRYHIESRDYDIAGGNRTDSFKHSFSTTVKIDLNE